jgi:hypothetical protein
MKSRLFRTVVTVALLAPGLARAQDVEGKVSLAVQVGTESLLSGGFLKDDQGTLLDKPLVIQSKRYKDVYAPNLRLQAVIGYGLKQRTELVVVGSYYKAGKDQETSGGQLTGGSGVEAGTFDGKQMFMIFDPYKEWGVEVSLRYYLPSRGRMKSYVAPVAGARFLDRILTTFYVPEKASTVINVPFHQSSTVAVFGLDLGFTIDLGKTAFFGVNTGLRYQTKVSPYPPPESLHTFNQSDGRLTAPVTASIGARF